MPALERYLSRRIRLVADQSRVQRRPLLILSGRYGLLDATTPILWYDEVLRRDTVDNLIPLLVQQLIALDVTSLVFYARPRTTPGWGPYHAVLERACARRRIPLRLEPLGPEFL